MTVDSSLELRREQKEYPKNFQEYSLHSKVKAEEKEHLELFAKEIQKIRAKAIENLSIKDFHHLQKYERWGRVSTLLGFLTAWLPPNPITIILLATGKLARWYLMHHIGHGGYDKVPGIPQRYTSKYFAMGKRRFIDWFDWMYPPAWNYEHNYLHHYHTNEKNDPDLLEENIMFLQEIKAPLFLKKFFFILIGISWKFSYYALNTLKLYEQKGDWSKEVLGEKLRSDRLNLLQYFNITHPFYRKLWFTCFLPYGLFHFVLLPALFLPLGIKAVFFVLLNYILAEVLHNFHTFILIVPNHAGEDLYRFSSHFTNKHDFYYRQVISTANYHCGTDFLDFWQMGLNYQIEHHLFPDLPVTSYRSLWKEVRALCEKFQIPYIQESVFLRFKKMYRIFIGRSVMKQWGP